MSVIPEGSESRVDDELDFFCLSEMPLGDVLKETRVLKEHGENTRIVVNRWWNTLLTLNPQPSESVLLVSLISCNYSKECRLRLRILSFACVIALCLLISGAVKVVYSTVNDTREIITSVDRLRSKASAGDKAARGLPKRP